MMLVFLAGFIVLCSAIAVCAEWHDPATGQRRPLWQRLTLVVLAVLELL
jgi:hypothetical protein